MGQAESRLKSVIRRDQFVTPEGMSWENFARCMRELNIKCRGYRNEKNEYFCFALRKGLVDIEQWKSSVEIACLCVKAGSDQCKIVRVLSFREFYNVYTTFSIAPKMDAIALAAAVPSTSRRPNAADIMRETCTEEGTCVVCLERPTDLLLPCLHSFCTICVIQWSEYHPQFFCPICKTTVDHPVEDSWEVTDKPDDQYVLDYFKELIEGGEKREQQTAQVFNQVTSEEAASL